MISPQSPDDKSRPARSVSDQRLSPGDPFRRANLPAIQPREEELQQLQRKKKELEEELAALRVSHLGLKLELEQERRRNAFWEERFFSTARSLGAWFEQAAFPMTCIDGDGRIIEANRKQLDLLGCNRTEYVGSRIDSYIKDPEVLGELVKALESGRMPRGLRTEVHCSDGTVKPVLLSFEPFSEGVSKGICCYMEDLSETSRTKIDQERSEDLLRHVIENLPDVFWLNSADSKEVFYVSPQYENIWGKPVEHLYREPLSYLDAVIEEDRPKVLAHLEQVDHLESAEVEYRVRCRNKNLFWVRERVFPVYRKDGSLDRIAKITGDITKSKQAEQRLRAWARQQEALAQFGLRALAEDSLAALFREANRVLVEILEVEAVEILERNKTTGFFCMIDGTGWKSDRSGKVRVPGGSDSYAGFTVARREPVFLEDLREEKRFRSADRLLDEGFLSGVTVAIPGRIDPFGVLGVYVSERRPFSADEKMFLQSIATLLGNAVERAEQQRKLDNIVRTLPAVIWEAEVDSESGKLKPTYISSYAQTMFGISGEEIVKEPHLWEELVEKVDLLQFENHVREPLGNRDFVTDEFRCNTRDGRTIWVELGWRVIREESGRPLAVSGVTLDVTARKEAEEKRWKLQQRFEETLRNIPAVVWESSFDEEKGEFVPSYISEFAEKLLPGFNREEWIRTGDLLQSVHLDDREQLEERIEAAFRGEKVSPAEFRLISDKGEIIWSESYKWLACDEAGKRIGVRGVILDITDRKKAEMERQAADERCSNLLANVPGVVWEMEIDPQTGNPRMKFVSNYIETLSGGFTKEEFLEDPNLWTERVHPEEREMVRKRMKELLQGRSYGSALTRWIRKDGRVIWTETSQQVVFDKSQQPIGLRGVTVDVTARKRAEIERNNALQRFRAFMDNSPFAAVVKDAEGRYIYGNRLWDEWCKYLGVEWKGRRNDEMFPPEAARRYSERDRKILEKGAETQSLEIVEAPDGEVQYWSIIRFPLPEAAGGGVLGALMINVTEQRILERRILEISDLERQRLGQELHDGICQHLLGLALMGQTLANEMESENQPHAKRVLELSKFFYEALDMARGLMKSFSLIELSGPGVLDEALKDFLKTTGKLFSKDLRFESKVKVEVLDRNVGSHLFRIAQEATHNAIKHGDPTAVVIRLERENDSLLLTVENDGLPFPDAGTRRSGMGLQTMYYRAGLIGATLSIAPRSGGGTVVLCKHPGDRGIRFLDESH